jgi:hypothetical protein
VSAARWPLPCGCSPALGCHERLWHRRVEERAQIAVSPVESRIIRMDVDSAHDRAHGLAANAATEARPSDETVERLAHASGPGGDGLALQPPDVVGVESHRNRDLRHKQTISYVYT